jgi:hypothetical protein
MRVVRVAAVLLLVATFGAATAVAQSMASIGLQGGVNQATVSARVGGNDLNPGYRTGAFGGVTAGYHFSHKFALQGGALYIGKGFEPGGSVQANLDVNYVDFPLLAIMTFPIGESLFAPRVFAGPVFSWRTTCNLATEPGDTSGVTDCELDAAKSFDFGVEVGAGIKIGKGVGGLTLDVAYNYGITNISNVEGDKINNRTLMFAVGWLFPIK